MVALRFSGACGTLFAIQVTSSAALFSGNFSHTHLSESRFSVQDFLNDKQIFFAAFLKRRSVFFEAIFLFSLHPIFLQLR
jgi:hypothetical protein